MPMLGRLLSRFRKVLIAVFVALAVFAVAGFLILPPIVKSVATKKISEKLHRQISVTAVKINPFALSATIEGLKLQERDGSGTFVSFDKLYANAEAASLLKGGIVLREVRLVNPYFHVVRRPDLTYNFSDLLEQETPPPKPSKPTKFSISNIEITGGRVEFDDQPMKTVQNVTDLDVGLPFISNLDYYVDTFVKPRLSAKVNGKPFELKGETKVFANSRETKFNIGIQNFSIPRYLPYVPMKFPFSIPSGLVDLDLHIYYRQFTGNKPPSMAVSGNAALREFMLKDGSGETVVSLPYTGVDVDSAEPMTKSFRIASVNVASPSINVVREKDGSINLLNLVKSVKGNTPPPPQPGKPAEGPGVKAEVTSVRITGGSVGFRDEAVKGTFHALIKPIDVQLLHVSTEPDWETYAEASLLTDAGESVSYKGGVVISPLRAQGVVDVKGVPLKRYAPYYRDKVLFDIVDGVFSCNTKFVYSMGANPDQRAYELSASVESLKLKRPREKSEFVRVSRFEASGVSADMVKREAVVGRLACAEAYVRAEKLKNGKIDLQSLVPPQPKKAAPKPAPGPEWVATVENVEAGPLAFDFKDGTTTPAAALVIDKAMLQAANISTKKGSTATTTTSLRINRKGTLSANGTFGINPVAATVALDLKRVEIAPFQPYFADKVNILVSDGDINTKGTLTVGFGKGGKLQAKFKGVAFVNSLESVDKQYANDFLNWKSLYFSGVDFSLNPDYLKVAGVALTDFYSRIIIYPDKTLNVQAVMVKKGQPQAPAQADGEKEETPTAAPAAPATPVSSAPPTAPAAAATTAAKPQKAAFPVSIEKVTFQGGRVNFTDESIKPKFTSDLMELGGRVTGLSSEETKLADLDVKCKFNNYAPMEITGKLNPLREDLYVDLKARYTDMDLSPLSPYSGKYVGYTIEKGKLNLDLQYLIDKKKLDAKNVIFIDQLTFGQKVDSPDATKLPVKFAVALLKDRKGEIHLDLPVEGRTDDPKFRIGRLIWQVIKNLLLKAATSPFALLGAIFGGGGEDLGYLEYGYGQSVITPDGAKKMDNLSKALNDRPALKLTIDGYVDQEQDRLALRKVFFDRSVKAQKLKDMIDEGKPAVPVDEVVVAPDEYEKYLWQAYKAQKFPKPRNIIGMVKKIPPEEQEKLMITHMEISDDDLRALASARSAAVKDYLINKGKVDPARVFIAQPKGLEPEKEEKAKKSRAAFTLS